MPDPLGVTLYPTSDVPDLSDMTNEEMIEAMVEWFHQNFEDPAQETPYESAEGGYQYIWGGPYEASDELFDAFGGVYDDEVITEAASRIESESGTYDWAPSGNRIRQELATDEDVEKEGTTIGNGAVGIGAVGNVGFDVVDGDGDEWPPIIAVPQQPGKTSSEEVIARLDALKEALDDLAGNIAGIGHNNPPEQMIVQTPIGQTIHIALTANINIVKNEVMAQTPDIPLIEEKVGFFRSVAIAIVKFLGSAVVGGMMGNAAYDQAVKHHEKILSLLNAAANAIMSWLQTPF